MAFVYSSSTRLILYSKCLGGVPMRLHRVKTITKVRGNLTQLSNEEVLSAEICMEGMIAEKCWEHFGLLLNHLQGFPW
jgi:hypothetical protein